MEPKAPPFTLEQQRILLALARQQREFTRALCDSLKGLIDLAWPSARRAEKGMFALRAILVEEKQLVTPEQCRVRLASMGGVSEM